MFRMLLVALALTFGFESLAIAGPCPGGRCPAVTRSSAVASRGDRGRWLPGKRVARVAAKAVKGVAKWRSARRSHRREHGLRLFGCRRCR